ncbi:hypothetical protein BST36_29700 [Mycolicibacterium moriokaense]|uniref:Uncharacterized protein n=1 Tax=Mycolicibacterium moriokaense TaxID=39691 RepID=A0AAD1HAA5_9MYCO|nr:hypothetical protein [Mycolicibacterium moriokaense]MCV7037468.1 hypothetical protein [Mycolicibacterium moriokaense]ORB13111.1 hypothetical protein BST36_29700 [Mycolicibacterium moriokaense]BBX00924.1 hypothetical protein MMOR_18600 [Mycolicibacterium moriokaense]
MHSGDDKDMPVFDSLDAHREAMRQELQSTADDTPLTIPNPYPVVFIYCGNHRETPVAEFVKVDGDWLRMDESARLRLLSDAEVFVDDASDNWLTDDIEDPRWTDRRYNVKCPKCADLPRKDTDPKPTTVPVRHANLVPFLDRWHAKNGAVSFIPLADLAANMSRNKRL